MAGQRPASDADDTALAAAIDYCRDVVTPNAAAWERQQGLPYPVLVAAAEVGLTGLLVPTELGGRALSYSGMARVMETLAGADLAIAFCLVVHNNLMGAIARDGSDSQRQRYLPDLMSMARPGAFLLTEPGTGSDAAAITTRAQPASDGWVIDGAKAWVTNAAHARILSVYAQTDPDLGARGIAAFLIDADAPGVAREPPYELLGGHAMGTAGFRFDAVAVEAQDVLVPPGQGFRAAMAGIDVARVNVAAMCCGMLDTSLKTALDHVSTRSAFGRKLADFQGLQWQLADVSTDLHAARLMTYDASRRIDAGESASIEAAHAKKFASRVCLDGVSVCMQALGARGLTQAQPLARHLAAAKIAQYLDGTTEIQNVVISRALFGATKPS